MGIFEIQIHLHSAGAIRDYRQIPTECEHYIAHWNGIT